MLTTLAFGILPAWRAGGVSKTQERFKDAHRGRAKAYGGTCVRHDPDRPFLLLVTLASLLSVSLTRLRGEPTGFDLDHVTIQTPPLHRLPQRGEAKLDLYQRIVDRIGQASHRGSRPQ